jgi:hypothetical protein
MAAFVKRNKRDRYREILSNPRLRHKFTNQLVLLCYRLDTFH